MTPRPNWLIIARMSLTLFKFSAVPLMMAAALLMPTACFAAQKEKMKDASVKFHLEKTARGSFLLHTVTQGKDTWVIGPGEKVGK